MDYNDFNGNPYDITKKAKEHMRKRKAIEREERSKSATKKDEKNCCHRLDREG